jgi:glutamine---fructose-6-phosphate transaminase (isomerizing)
MTAEPTFDPTAQLAGPADPWDYAPTPSLRTGPPYHMTEMIAAEPALARRLLGRLADRGGAAGDLAEAIRATLTGADPVIVTGCGTSEHAALAAAEVLREAAAAVGLPATVTSEQAFELSLASPTRGLVIAVSHEGATGATNAALCAARDAGRPTAVITVSGRSPAAALADIVVETGELDQGWCHTVGYLSPILAAAAVGMHLSGRSLDAGSVEGLIAAGAADASGAERIAAILAQAATLLVIASGADRPAGRELVLKVEEAAWLPSAFRDLETFLHGHLPATGPETGLVLILTDGDRRAERLARARQALAAARVIGLRAAAIVSAEIDASLDPALTPAGRLVVPEVQGLPGPVAALLGSATPLQLLTERLARARGTNPDPIRRDDPVYLAAAEAAEATEARDAKDAPEAT